MIRKICVLLLAPAFLFYSDDGGGKPMANNPRSANGNLRKKHRARFRAMNAPCGICMGRLGPIRYDQPSDASHPLSFVIDEIRPISKHKLFGYETREAAAQDWNNLQAAHWCCNAAKGARTSFDGNRQPKAANLSDGEW